MPHGDKQRGILAMTEDEMEGLPEKPPSSTFAEPPTANGTAYMSNGRGSSQDLSRKMSREISLHFEDGKEYDDYELERQRYPRIEECPTMTPVQQVNAKDPHWTPTFDGSVRPRLELSYVKPQEYNGVLHEIQPISQDANNNPKPGSHSPIPEAPTPSPTPPSSPTHAEDDDVPLTERTKRRKKKKKKKVVKIVADR